MRFSECHNWSGYTFFNKIQPQQQLVTRFISVVVITPDFETWLRLYFEILPATPVRYVRIFRYHTLLNLTDWQNPG